MDKKGESRIDAIGPGFFLPDPSDADVPENIILKTNQKREAGKMNMKKMIWVLMGVLFLAIPLAGAEVVTFDDLSLDPESYYNGSDGAEGFTSTGVRFNNFFDDTYGPYWEGFAYSQHPPTRQHRTIPINYSAITGSGTGGSGIYGVAYLGFYGIVPTITFADEVNLAEMYVTNTTYAFLAMQDGNAPAKKFGGDTGNDPDYYRLTITGKDVDEVVTAVVDFYPGRLPFRRQFPGLYHRRMDHRGFEFSRRVKTIEFSVSSSDTGDYGINTPTYLAIDSIAIDQCPDDPDKIDAGICGCGIPDDDTDQDGTPDCNDGCPDDPDKIEPGVCGCGTSDADSDGDGIPDCEDSDNSKGRPVLFVLWGYKHFQASTSDGKQRAVMIACRSNNPGNHGGGH